MLSSHEVAYRSMRFNAEAFLGMPASLDTPCGLLGMLAYAAERLLRMLVYAVVWPLEMIAYGPEQLLRVLAHGSEQSLGARAEALTTNRFLGTSGTA
jgi:hypothetical protein